MLNDEMKLFVMFCVFLLGAYITSTHTATSVITTIGGSSKMEGFDSGVGGGGVGGTGSPEMITSPRCPNVLVQKGTVLFLYNTKLAPVPGVNPIRFENLEEYVEFMEWLRGQGIKCPVLFLQHSVSAQGESIYSIRPSPTNLQGGLSPNIANSQPLHPPVFGTPTKGIGAGLDNIDASTMFSPEQISEITRIIDQSGDNDPYNASLYPNGWSNTVIKPADKASLFKIQASYLQSNAAGNRDYIKPDGYPGLAAAAAAAATSRFGPEYDNSRDNEYTNDHYKIYDDNGITNENSYLGQLAATRKKQLDERERALEEKAKANARVTA
jgi:hypothetical protein